MGQLDLAAAVLVRSLKMLVGDRLRQGPLLAQMVDVELARDDVGAAARAAERLEALAAGIDSPVIQAEAALPRGRVHSARGEPVHAAGSFEAAQRHLDGEERPVLCGTVRYELARALLATGDSAAAITEARAALAVFERLGAAVHIDMTAALLRSLGAPGRSRRRAAGAAVAALTPREREVLCLVRQGLTNPEIGSRLYITAKTAEHHVGRILTKLGVRSRAEAAAIAVESARGN